MVTHCDQRGGEKSTSKSVLFPSHSLNLARLTRQTESGILTANAVLSVGTFVTLCLLISHSQLTAQEQTTSREVKAFIVHDPNKLVPETMIDLGSASPSTSFDVKLALLNTTDQEIVFDRTEHACNCTELEPKSGRIVPGQSVDLRVTLRTPDAPRETRGSTEVTFYHGEARVLSAKLSFGYDHHVGLPIRMLTVGFGPTTQNEEFEIPIIIGSKVKADGFNVEVEGLDVGFRYDIDRDRSVLRGFIDLKSQLDFSRLYGRLNVVDLDSSRIQSVPLVIEREVGIQVYPRSLRFCRAPILEEDASQLSEKENPLVDKAVGDPKEVTLADTPWKANVYAKLIEELASDSTGCKVNAVIGDSSLSCVAKPLGDLVYKIEICVSSEQAALMSQSDGQQGKSRSVHLTVSIGKTPVSEIVPFYFQEFEK